MNAIHPCPCPSQRVLIMRNLVVGVGPWSLPCSYSTQLMCCHKSTADQQQQSSGHQRQLQQSVLLVVTDEIVLCVG